MDGARRRRIDGWDGVALRSPGGELEATFVPALANVCCSLALRGEELLELRDGLGAYAQRASTIAIPLLHPWANRLGATRYEVADAQVDLDPATMPIKTDAAGLPMHGALPSRMAFELVDAGESSLSAALRWESPDLLAAFPFPHELRCDARLDDAALTLTTSLTATGERAVPVAFGYHPYLRLRGPRERCELALPPLRRLELDERQVPTGAGRDVAAGAVGLGGADLDDAYGGVAQGAALVLRDGGRELAVRFEHGYPNAQVYSPGGAGFCALEPMTAPANALISGDGLRLVEPGETFSARFAIVLSGSA